MRKRFLALSLLSLGLLGLSLSGCDRSETLNYSVSYLAGDGGTLTYTINGQSSAGHSYYIQYVFRGKNSNAVTAVPNASKGYVFVEWKEDGSKETTRYEEKVYQNFVFTAVFALES